MPLASFKEWAWRFFPRKWRPTYEVLPLWCLLVRRCKGKCRETARRKLFHEERGKNQWNSSKGIIKPSKSPQIVLSASNRKGLLWPGGSCLSISAFKEKGSPADSAVALDFISFHFQSVLDSLRQDPWFTFLQYWKNRRNKKIENW